MKKLISAISLLLVCIICCSCGAFQVKDVSVIATVNGEDILLEEYNYFLLVAQQTIYASVGESAYAEDFWTTEIDGKNFGELAKENALNDAINYTLISQKAKELGISSETPEAQEQINTALSSASEFIKQYGFSKEAMRSVLEKLYFESALLVKAAENGEIDTSEETLKKVYEEKFRTIKHILVSTTSPQDGSEIYTLEEANLIATQIKDQLNNGADFDEVMNTQSMDPGLASAPNGYTFTNNGSMVASFENAAFALEIGEISDLVPSSYGYHILKREPLISYEEFLAQNENDVSSISVILEQTYEENLVTEIKAQATIERNEKVYAKVSLY